LGPELRTAGCTNHQIAELLGIGRSGVSRRIKHLAVMQRYDIRLGAVGSVSVIVNIRRPAALPGETRAWIQQLIEDIEALRDSGRDA